MFEIAKAEWGLQNWTEVRSEHWFWTIYLYSLLQITDTLGAFVFPSVKWVYEHLCLIRVTWNNLKKMTNVRYLARYLWHSVNLCYFPFSSFLILWYLSQQFLSFDNVEDVYTWYSWSPSKTSKSGCKIRSLDHLIFELSSNVLMVCSNILRVNALEYTTHLILISLVISLSSPWSWWTAWSLLVLCVFRCFW